MKEEGVWERREGVLATVAIKYSSIKVREMEKRGRGNGEGVWERRERIVATVAIKYDTHQ